VRLLAVAAAIIAALALGVALSMLLREKPLQRFQIVNLRDGNTVWRLDTVTGQVSVCGATLAGTALAQAQEQLSNRIRAAGSDRQALKALTPDIDQLDMLSRPRCSAWSVP
jgi:hypothetical protein